MMSELYPLSISFPLFWINLITFYFSFRLADNLNDVYSANFSCIPIEFVQKRNHLLFVGDGDIEPAQVGILFNNFHKIIDIGNLEIHIFRIDAFGPKLFVKVAD